MAWIESRRAKSGRVTWFVYWREGGRGSAKRCRKAGTRRRDAERLAVEIQARVNAGLAGDVLARRMTLSQYADRWLATRIVRHTTLRRDRGLIDTYLRPAFGRRPLSAISVEDVQVLLARASKVRRPATVRRLLAVLGKMLGDAAKNDYIRQNPVARLDPSDKPRQRRAAQVVDLNDVVRVLTSLPQEWAAYSLLALLTGLRWGELVSLRWSDLDFLTGLINVRRATPAGTPKIGELKSLASARNVEMLWPVREILLALPHDSQLVFSRVSGHANFYKRIWLRAVRAVRSSLRFHDLRHGFASLLLAWGEPILYVGQQLGHSNALFTLTTYAHLIREGRRLDREETLRFLVDDVLHRRGPVGMLAFQSRREDSRLGRARASQIPLQMSYTSNARMIWYAGPA